jgi:hypothetical protein
MENKMVSERNGGRNAGESVRGQISGPMPVFVLKDFE